MRYKLIEKRKERKLTLEQVATMLGIPRSTYNAYELGNTTPPLDIAIKIKKLFKVKNDDIFLIDNVRETDEQQKSEDETQIE